jgi:AraC-like DNA-binding protein
MSRARFAEYFKEKIGIAPINYLTALRINVAMRRLQQGKSIKSLCGELGYSSASSFTRVFLQKIGMSPKEWLANKAASD